MACSAVCVSGVTRCRYRGVRAYADHLRGELFYVACALTGKIACIKLGEAFLSALIKVFAGGYKNSVDDAGFIATINNSTRAVVIAAYQGNGIVLLVVGVWLDKSWQIKR